MSKDPAVLFYINDWLTSTCEMDADCRGWYLNLILHNYDKGSLPDDIEKLAVLSNVKFSEFERFKQVFEQVIVHKFERTDNGRLINKKASTILMARELFKDKRSNAGKMSYLMRYFMKTYRKEYSSLKLREYVKENIELDVNLRDEHLLKQMFEHLFELYRNENENENEIKDNKEESMRETIPIEKTPKELEFDRFNEWIDSNIPLLRKIQKQATFDEYVKMTNKYNGEQIRVVLTKMANWKNTPKNNTTVYFTFLDWAKREYNG